MNRRTWWQRLAGRGTRSGVREPSSESEDRFLRMADSLPDGLIIIEGERTVFVNDRACQIFGYPREELMGLRDLDVAVPEERERLESIIDDIDHAGSCPDELEFWIQRKDGSRRYVHSRYLPSRVGEAITGRFVVTADVTERKRAEEALERLKDFNERIVQTMAEGIVVNDAQGVYNYVNPAASSMLGYGEGELVGCPWVQVIPEDQRPIVEEANRRRAAGISDRYELEVIRKDGSRLQTLVSGCPLFEAGTFAGTLAVFTDITLQKREERELEELLRQTQQQAEQIRRIMHTVPEGVVVTDEAFRVVHANCTAEGYLEALQEPALGSLERLGGVSMTELLATTNGGPWREIRPPGSARTFELAIRPLDTHGWVIVIRDVTHERMAQLRVHEAERMAAVGQVASGVAHDFNNILASVLGHTQLLLRDRSLPASVAERLQSIAEQGHRAASLVGQLLDYTRQSLIDRVPVDLNAVVNAIGETMAGAIPDNIELSIGSMSGSCWVEGSPTQLGQVVVNLVRNAIDAMPSGGQVRIGLGAQRLNAGELPSPDMTPGDWAILHVADTGRGIPPEHLPRLFQPFFTTKEVGQGTGLGLAQAWGLVRQHGGFIDVATTMNLGTTFTVYLPIRACDEKPAPGVGKEPARDQGSTILLVEDEPAVRDVAAAMLEEFGFHVIKASSGSEALEIHERHGAEIALVLTDLMMPGMDGVALVENLAARDPSVRVLVVTGHPLDEASRRRISPACVGWLQKPVVMDQLMAAVAAALNRTP